jgi:hypothetical protein
LGDGDERVEVILLDARAGLAQLIESNLAVRMPACLVIGNVPILTQTAVGEIDARVGNPLRDGFQGAQVEPDAVLAWDSQLRVTGL